MLEVHAVARAELDVAIEQAAISLRGMFHRGYSIS